MSSGGMDGFDWLQIFLPADSQPDHDPNPNNEAYQTHPAFHDAEVARAAVMHQRTQNSYSFLRSTNARANHALNPAQVYSQASGGQYGGNKHQQTSDIKPNNSPSGHSVYPTDRSHNINQQPIPPVPSQQHLNAQPCEGMDPAPYPWRTFNFTPNYSDAYQSTQRAHETAMPTVPAQRTNQPTARAVPTLQSSYQSYSAIPNQNSQMLTQPHMEQGMMAQVQRTRTPAASQSNPYSHPTIPSHNDQRPPHSTAAQRTRPTSPVQRTHTPVTRPQTSQRPYQRHSTTSAQNTQKQSFLAAAQRPWPGPPVQRKRTPVARAQASQSPYQNHSPVPAQNVQRSSHPNAPPSSHSSIDSEFYTPLVSPKGFKTSAARNTLESRQSITPAKITQEASNPRTQSPATNSTISNQIPPRPSFHNQDHLQSTVPTTHRVHSPVISQFVSTRSPFLSLVSSAPTSTSTPAPPTQTTIVSHHLDKGWTQEKEGTQDKAAPTSPYQAPNQASQRPPISQPNEQRTPVVPSAFASPTSPAASHLRPSYNASHISGPRRGTFSDSAVTQQPAAGNTQSRGSPLSGPNRHQKKRWVPTEENSMLPTKMRRLDNGESQTMTLQNDPSASSSVPGAQVSTEYARPRCSGKFLKNRDDLVQPIRWNDALPKVSYDPTTIARDVLIAAARHPTEKHLNHHLEPLRRNFTKIDYFANLATFRWDLVDVKQPETQVDRVPSVPAPHTPPLQPPHPQSPQAARHLIARDSTITYHHVTTCDYAPMTSRDTSPNRQVAMAERIDARAPPGGLSPWGILPFKPPTYHSPQRIFSSNLPSGLPRIDSVPASPKFSSHQSVPLPTPPPPQPQPRPQQRRSSTTNNPAPPKPTPATKQPTPKSTTKPRPQGQTVKSQPDSGRAVKSPEARRLPQPQVVIPLSPVKMTTKRRPGRYPKNAVANIEVAIHREPPVHYQIFPCKWEECTAELHNIESVRAHLIKVHIPHTLVCKWQDCGNKTPMAAADMFTHLSLQHVSKMAWELGDGPTVPVTAENKSNHPSVPGDRSARKGTMVLPVDEHQVKAFSKAHRKSTEKNKAQALLEAGQHWKQQIGPEMDWSDRRLSTPARQSNVHCGEMAFVGEN
ncbi:hypothetical protein N7537_007246 [Penicillium hordei]|uniref:C2H2-type domain-containing protein n=1 Tax=Penicillium hordei TaxID=40994 RepID=A0AAD6E903_9EURO|nr:uncharacterized protein N7537_007246 [Penicillium hordei]KAJ5604290.1 hypothetical protein N7537_007246 [Penicillium hordei]